MSSDEPIPISSGELLRQSGFTMEDYLRRAIAAIDNQFGEGFADKHPELVVEAIRSQSADFNTSLVCKILGKCLQDIGESLSEIAQSLRDTR